MAVTGTILRALLRPATLARAAEGVEAVAGALRPHATRQMELGHDAFVATQQAAAEEYRHARGGWFDALVNGLNRLPRPMLALGTLGLFVYAMADPAGFALRMTGLAAVPEPLWWLLGAVVAFYFGARETHYLRAHRPVGPPPAPRAPEGPAEGPAGIGTGAPARNPALADWQASRDDLDPDA